MFQTTMQNNMSGLFATLIILGILLTFAAVIALTAFWILMIIDCAKRKHLTDSERIAWILVLVFLGFLGASIYYIAVKRQR